MSYFFYCGLSSVFFSFIEFRLNNNNHNDRVLRLKTQKFTQKRTKKKKHIFFRHLKIGYDPIYWHFTIRRDFRHAYSHIRKDHRAIYCRCTLRFFRRCDKCKRLGNRRPLVRRKVPYYRQVCNRLWQFSH